MVRQRHDSADLRIRSRLASAGVMIAAHRMRVAMEAKFNPDQPRVPAGQPDGGQWTNGSDGASGLAASIGGRSSPITAGDAPRPSASSPTGTPSSDWLPLPATRRADGSIASQTMVAADGSSIRTDFALPGSASGFTERHTVSLPDGTVVVFENRGDEQVVKDAQGRTLGGTLWTPTGPEPLAVAKPAFAPAIAYAVVDAALTLYSLYTALNLPSLTPVFTPGTILAPGAADGSGEPSTTLLLKDSIPKMCPRYPEVQDLTDMAAQQAELEGPFASAALRGTAVHSKLKKMVDGLADPQFRAEESYLKSLQEGAFQDSSGVARYGERRTIRVDLLEDTNYNTICVYDIKTGKSGLTLGRMREIARSVRRAYPDRNPRIVVIQVKPQ